MINPVEQSEGEIARLYRLGLTPTMLMKIGAFVVTYGLFETNLERALWALTGEDVNGVRPFTEKLSAAKWIERLGEGHAEFSPACNQVLHTASLAAADLSAYRNSLIHGHLLAIGGVPSFLSNPAWHGEVRNKSHGDAYIKEPTIDMMIFAAAVLHRVSRHAVKAVASPEHRDLIEKAKDDVQRARSYANEIRHLCALMNHEKY
jgi:hypothetical protein